MIKTGSTKLNLSKQLSTCVDLHDPFNSCVDGALQFNKNSLDVTCSTIEYYRALQDLIINQLSELKEIVNSAKTKRNLIFFCLPT